MLKYQNFLSVVEVTIMVKAVWKDTVIAECDKTEVIEGNHYFPPECVNKNYLKESGTTSTCPWKGNAKYYHVEINDDTLKDAAWYYPEPKEAANKIKGYVAFWKDVKVVE